jgi:D-alanine-D-alanine ligase
VRKLRVLVLLREGLEPPDSIEGMSNDEVYVAPWKTEYDVVTTLRELDHQVRILGLYDDLRSVGKAVEEFRPHITFNMMEEFGGIALYDQNVVAYLELKGMKYTGCNPRGLVIARDKALSKKLLAYHRIRVPEFQVFRHGRKARRRKRLRFPLFVKSVTEDASLGISQASLVKDDQALRERVAFVHEHAGTDAIAEEFIGGRELYVGVLGNQRLEVLPVWELLFEEKPEDQPLIATARAKWNLKYQKKWGVVSRAAKRLPKGMRDLIVRRCKRIYRNLGLSGYARLDFRLDKRRLYFLEANPNPQLAYGEEFAESARKKGLRYVDLIQRIISLGLRFKPLRLL